MREEGRNLKLGYFAQQSLDLLDPELTVQEQMQQARKLLQA